VLRRDYRTKTTDSQVSSKVLSPIRRQTSEIALEHGPGRRNSKLHSARERNSLWNLG
jgi:hypothetical protein